MSTNLTINPKTKRLKKAGKESRKKVKEEEEMDAHIFVPGCTRCHQLHMSSMTCSAPPEIDENEPKISEKEFLNQMRSAAAFRTAKYREATGDFAAADSNNNSIHQRNRNMPPPPPSSRRGGGRGSSGSRRAPIGEGPPVQMFKRTYLDQSSRAPPPPPSRAPRAPRASRYSRAPSPSENSRYMPQLMDGFDRLSVHNNHHHHHTYPYPRGAVGDSDRGGRGGGGGRFASSRIGGGASGRGEGPRVSSGFHPPSSSSRRNPLQMTHRPNKFVVPPNEAHMRRLNDQLRYFSYGDESMYREVPMPRPKIEIVPRVPPNQMYVFTKRTVYDENGRKQGVTKREAKIVHVTGSEVVFIDYYDDLKL